MIGEIVAILQNDSTIANAVGTSQIFPIQRKQGSGLPAIVVDLIDIKTNETKHQSSDLDFITIQVSTYSDNPKQSYDLAMSCRNELDQYVGTVNGEQLEVRFDDLETGLSAEDETFVTISEYIVTVKRTAQAPHD